MYLLLLGREVETAATMVNSNAQGRVGIDTGGTFTDCVSIDDATNRIGVVKLPSRPADPHEAVIAAFERSREEFDDGPGHFGTLIHGTTIGTNAVITGDYARTGLITNRGFRDVLEIGTQQRRSLYNLRQGQRPVFIPRDLRLEVSGRIAADGSEIEPVDDGEVAAAVAELQAAEVESVAVAGLFSYVNPDQEALLEERVRELAPDLYVVRSSSASREPREYPRFATVAVNAALAPRIEPYIRRLLAELEAVEPDCSLLIMQSSGGISTVERSVGERVHQLILSGPAAGVIGGAHFAEKCGFDNCVTFDLGGTSTDIGVVRGGTPRTGFQMELPNGVPCNLPHIEVETIGAGGGSIGWVDPGGGLNVGPHSAGADPGPACYGRGGTEPTVTDAHLLLGRLSTAGLIGGRLALDADLAAAALGRLGEALDLDIDSASLGLLAVLEENMVGAIRRAAARHGEDLREFVIVAGGGAGPLHAAGAMRSLNMRAAVIPGRPGLLSAFGLLTANIRHDLSVTVLSGRGGVGQVEIDGAFERLRAEADANLAADGVDPVRRRFEHSLEVRYPGQDSTLRVEVEPGEALELVAGRFHDLHENTFGHSSRDSDVELVATRLVGTGLGQTPEMQPEMPADEGEPVERRTILFDPAAGRIETPIYLRETLAVGQRIVGPAIVEQMDTTTIVPPGINASVDPTGSIILTAEGGAAG
jgi:N-methylhydantoinase A